LLLTKTFYTWRHLYLVRKRLRAFHRLRMERIAKPILLKWHEYTQKTKYERNALLQFTNQRITKILYTTFQIWKNKAMEKIVLKTKLMHYETEREMRLKRLVMIKWKEYVQISKRETRLINVLSARRNFYLLKTDFGLWKKLAIMKKKRRLEII